MPDAVPPPSSPGPPGPGGLERDVALCRAESHFMDRLRELYADVQARIDAAGFQCRACGQCCHFARAGHRVYVSTGELALLASAPPPPDGAAGPLRCAYQAGQACTACTRRPLGCRVYFCTEPGHSRAAETYEEIHRAIRAAHRDAHLPYRYTELTAALAELFPA